MSGRKKRPTIRERLAALLTEAGYPPRSLPRGAQGFYRIEQKHDDTVTCWTAWTMAVGIAGTQINSYDTMTDCVRYGFDVHATPDGYSLWVYAKKPKATRA